MVNSYSTTVLQKPTRVIAFHCSTSLDLSKTVCVGYCGLYSTWKFDYGLRQLTLQTYDSETTLFFPTEPELRKWENALQETEEVILRQQEDGVTQVTLPIFVSDTEYLPVTVDENTTAQDVSTFCW